MVNSKYGFGFFIECWKNYWGGNIAVPILFLISIIYIICKRDKLWNRAIVFPFVLGLCTIFNPWLMNRVLGKLNWYNRYYRFYWIVPVSLLISVAFADIWAKCKKEWMKVCLVIFGCFGLLCFGNPVLTDFSHWNIYKVDHNAIECSDIIHQDTEEEEPTVLVNLSLAMTIRQYDPSLKAVHGLFDFLPNYYSDVSTIYDNYISRGEYLKLFGNYNVEVESELINQSLKEMDVDYFIRYKSWYSDEYIQSLNLFRVGETEEYDVYRVID